MTETRLGARNCFPLEYLHEPGYLDHMKEQTRCKLGQELVGYIIDQTSPTVVRISESLNDFDLFLSEYKLIVDLSQLQMMQVRMMELPPFEFVSRTADERIVIEWQCGYCGQVNLVTEHLECRKCGVPRKVIL